MLKQKFYIFKFTDCTRLLNTLKKINIAMIQKAQKNFFPIFYLKNIYITYNFFKFYYSNELINKLRFYVLIDIFILYFLRSAIKLISLIEYFLRLMKVTADTIVFIRQIDEICRDTNFYESMIRKNCMGCCCQPIYIAVNSVFVK